MQFLQRPASSMMQQQEHLGPETKFQSSFARCLNLPPQAMDHKTWLENELLETRQVTSYLGDITKPKMHFD